MNTIGVEIVKAFLFFCVGFATGYFVRGLRDKIGSSIDNEKVIALMIAGTYAVSILAGIFVVGYQTPFGLHGIMGGIVGFYFKKRGDKNAK